MKKLLFISIGFILAQTVFAQNPNPWKSIGKPAPEILTLSNGRYPEVFENDSLRKVGSVVFNIRTNKIEYLIETDTMYSEATLQPEIVSRWLSLDPLARKYPGMSPYNFVGNNPIIFIDPDGREIVWANDAESQKTKEAVLKLVNDSKLFAAVYNYLDGLEKKFYASENHDLIQESVRKATGYEGAKAGGMKQGNNVFFSKELSDNSSFSEEFFHLFQSEVYESEDKKPNPDAEAKLFNGAVLLETASRNDGGFVEKVKSASNGKSQEELKANFYYNGNIGYIISIALDDNDGGSIKISPNSNAQKAFNNFLKQFDDEHSNFENDPYSGGNKEASPKAYNKAVDEVEK